MKTIIILISCLTIGGIFAVQSILNAPSVSYSTELVLLRDITELDGLRPDINEMLLKYKLYEYPNQLAIFHYRAINDVSINPINTVKLIGVGKWFSNEFDRQDSIAIFEKRISDMIENEQAVHFGRPQSSIYLPVAEELTRLSKSQANHRIIAIYSDLLENNPSLSLYGSHGLVSSGSDAVRRVLEVRMSLPELKGIEVYLIYQPKNVIDNQRYLLISKAYKDLLESKGAIVQIGANLTQ